MRIGQGVPETSAGPDGREHSPVVGRAMSFVAGARAVGPTVEEQQGQGQLHCE